MFVAFTQLLRAVDEIKESEDQAHDPLNIALEGIFHAVDAAASAKLPWKRF